jgi:HAD superfamily hydrolase (TIGR01549 family)
MIKLLNSYLNKKKYFVFDFDRTLAKMEIDWNGWHAGISKIYTKYDPNHGYVQGKNPHIYHNQLVTAHGDQLLQEVRDFNRQYESQYLTGFTPNTEVIQFILENPSITFYVYSSNSKPTVTRGLDELGISKSIRAVISKDDVKFVKPNPEGFFLLENFEGNEEEFLMIGDSSADRGAAEAAGIDFLECTVFEKYHEEERK